MVTTTVSYCVQWNLAEDVGQDFMTMSYTTANDEIAPVKIDPEKSESLRLN